MKHFGLLGKNISYSFSRTYFTEKFRQLDIAASYKNFELGDISGFPDLIKKNPQLDGLNVTIPYKEQVIPFLDELDPVAREIGAVNTVRFLPGGSLKGYNTDWFGFRESILPFLRYEYEKALILGTGGAAKAVEHALQSLDIQPAFVSRTRGPHQYSYQDLDRQIMQEHPIIVNCTPLGTTPDTTVYPDIPLQFISENHLICDLIYNPAVTRLMELSAKRGARSLNGSKMLEFQAEKAWEIWNWSD